MCARPFRGRGCISLEDLTLVATIALVLGAATVGGLLARRIGQPALLGYIVAGVLIGPYTPGAVADRSSVELLANLGVAFLMFALGLEFSRDELRRVRRVAILGGSLQLGLTLGLGIVAGLAIGWPLPAAILLGSAFAISSSIVAITLLAGRGQLEATGGRIALGLGVVQDLAVVPLLALLPLLSGPVSDPVAAVAWAVGIAVLALAIVVIAGAWIAPRVFGLVARTGSPELFVMTVVVVALGTGLASERAGLSFALGAFLAGVVVSESEFDGQVLAQIIPLRDLFASIFFVAVGMLIDPAFLLAHLGPALILLAALVVGKFAIVMGALLLAGVDFIPATLAGSVLAQMGEFSFVIAGIGSAHNVLAEDQYAMILAVALASIVLASPLMSLAPSFAKWAMQRRNRELMESDLAEVATTAAVDVVICGYGRIGLGLATMLQGAGHSFSIIDLDPVVVRSLRNEGHRAYYGDASMEPVQVRAGVGQARILALALPDLIAAAQAVRVAQHLNPALRVIALTGGKKGIAVLERSGVHEVIHPDFEISLGFGRQVLRWLGMSSLDARAYAFTMRDAFYGLPAEGGAGRRSRGRRQQVDGPAASASVD